MATINLATKYSPKVVDKFYLDSVILGKTSKEYEWDGVNSIKIWTINTYAPTDYTKPANDNAITGQHARYGYTYEVADTVQTLALAQDKAVSLSVDKGNNTEQMLIKNAGKVMNLEMREQFIPLFDMYCLARWSGQYGTSASTPSWASLVSAVNDGTSAFTKSNIVDKISAGITTIRNNKTTVDDAYCYIGETNYARLLLAQEFINYNNPAFAKEHLERGVMGKLRGLQIVPVPDEYLKKSVIVSGVTTAVNNPFLNEDLHFMIVKRSSVLAPTKIKDMKVHSDPVGISGALLEIRWLFDAFVLDTKAKGVYASLVHA